MAIIIRLNNIILLIPITGPNNVIYIFTWVGLIIYDPVFFYWKHVVIHELPGRFQKWDEIHSVLNSKRQQNFRQTYYGKFK